LENKIALSMGGNMSIYKVWECDYPGCTNSTRIPFPEHGNIQKLITPEGWSMNHGAEDKKVGTSESDNCVFFCPEHNEQSDFKNNLCRTEVEPVSYENPEMVNSSSGDYWEKVCKDLAKEMKKVDNTPLELPRKIGALIQPDNQGEIVKTKRTARLKFVSNPELDRAVNELVKSRKDKEVGHCKSIRKLCLS